jgi:hypothetical protein
VDDLSGAVHRKYSKLPNPTFLINKEGQVAFRMIATQPEILESAIEDLLRGPDNTVVQGGENASVSLTYPMLHAYRAIERGGEDALEDFRFAFGMPGRAAVETTRFALPGVESAGSALTAAGLSILVLAGAIWAGSELRKRRFRYDPYLYDWGPEDEAVGI